MWGVAGISTFLGTVSGFNRSRRSPGHTPAATLRSADVRHLQRLLHRSASQRVPAAAAAAATARTPGSGAATSGGGGALRQTKSDDGAAALAALATSAAADGAAAAAAPAASAGMRVSVELMSDVIGFSFMGADGRERLFAAELSGTGVQLTLSSGQVTATATVTDAQVSPG